MTQEDATAQEEADGEPTEASGTDDDADATGDAGEKSADEEREAESPPADEETEAETLVARVAAVDEELAEEVATLADRAADLAADLDDREAEVEALTERLQRTQADFQNYKKRAKKRQEQLEAQATRNLVERLLDVRDDLGRALADESGDVEALREGVELTVEEFDRVLESEGVDEISPEPGDEVDPNRHEVMLQVDSDEPEGTIAEVYRPGYAMDGTVLRAAQVTVSDGGNEE